MLFPNDKHQINLSKKDADKPYRAKMQEKKYQRKGPKTASTDARFSAFLNKKQG